TFLDRHGGTKSFQWKPPLEPLGLYRCAEYKPTPMGGENYSLSATFQQAFKP
ncbi:phage tail protein, partial [Enterobacter hormaechei]